MSSAPDQTASSHAASLMQHCVPAHNFMEHMVPLGCEEAMPLSTSLIYHLFLLNSILERSANQEAERHHLTIPQWLALGCIGNEGKKGITHSELCHRLMLSKSPVTGIVDRLVRDGYAVRTVDPKDRRVSRIAINSSGEAAWKRVRDALREHAHAHCSILSEEEQQTLLTLLSRLMENVARADPLLPDWNGDPVKE